MKGGEAQADGEGMAAPSRRDTVGEGEEAGRYLPASRMD